MFCLIKMSGGPPDSYLMGAGVVCARTKRSKREINLFSQCYDEIKMNEADLFMPSRYGQGKVYLYYFMGGHSNYITLFKNKITVYSRI